MTGKHGRGDLPDRAALFCVLTRLHTLNLILVSVTRLGEWSLIIESGFWLDGRNRVFDA